MPDSFMLMFMLMLKPSSSINAQREMRKTSIINSRQTKLWQLHKKHLEDVWDLN